MHMISIGRAFAGITAGLLTLFAYTTPGAQAATPNGDCTRVAHTDQHLCTTVRTQHAYGWTDNHGNPKNWNANGRTLVHDITHQGYTTHEMRDALQSAHRYYRAYVTHVTFNTDVIRKRCGTDGMGAVQFIDEDGKPGGAKYTWKRIICA